MNESINQNFSVYLQPTRYIDSNSDSIIEYAKQSCAGAETDVEKAIKLYYAVRDDILYDPYGIDLAEDSIKASAVLKKRTGYCVAKAVLLAAVLRSQGIPSRLGFADVKNHLVTKNLRELMGSDIFTYHGYTEVYLNEKWVKATPAFNLTLCERFKVKPLEFDGINDSVFHPYDRTGSRHMEYLVDHGHFADLPVERIHQSYMEHYPTLAGNLERPVKGDFAKEAEGENK